MTENEKPIDEIIGEGADAGPGPSPNPSRQAVRRGTPRRTANQRWTYAALKDERGKRQALAERTAELEAQLQAYAQQQRPAKADDIWTNPEGYIPVRSSRPP